MEELIMLKNKLILMLCAIGITLSMATKVMAANNIERIWGNDRYDTAIQVSKSGWSDGAEYAILANGENFPDALSATPLAKKYNAPILLNPSSTLDSRVEGELKRLCVKQVFIIGGSAVVPDSVKNKLEQLNIKTTRLWGQNRYETSIKIAEQLDFNGQVAVANGEGFADALSISPIAAQKSMPVILTPSNTLSDATAKYIKNNNITKTYIVGENDVVSDKIANSFPNSERIWGSSKYNTNVAVLNKFKNDLDLSNIYLANGENFPDALAGSALAAKNSSAIVLVDDSSGETTENFMFSNITSKSKTNILGGNSVIPTQLINNIFSTLGNTNGNLYFKGLAAKQGDWIYFADLNGGIYKSKEDGSGLVQLVNGTDRACSINIVDDWIYYTVSEEMYKIKIDGSNKTKVMGIPASNKISVIGDTIYYTCVSEDASLWFAKVNIDGSGHTILNKEYMDSLNIVGNWIYYKNSDDGKVYKIKVNGSNKSKIVDDVVGQVIVYKGYIYYSDGNAIYRTKLDGSEKVTIISDPSINYLEINISNDYIYYTGADGSLYKVKTDGSSKSRVVNINTLDIENAYRASISLPNIVGDWIYYTCDICSYQYELSTNLYRVKIDGSENTLLDSKKLQ
jgi:N-acetylmuramoyl-L-alanine amidase